MSKKLIEVHNFTDRVIRMDNFTRRAVMGLQRPLPKGKHPLPWDIPDNSDSAKYFDSNHTMVTIIDPATDKVLKTFSYWDDDWKKFEIFMCDGKDWKSTTRPMRGGKVGDNNAKVILHVTENVKGNGEFELTAFVVTEDQLKKNVLNAFKAFSNHPDINLIPGKKYTNSEIASYMAHPAFQPVKDAAAEGGFLSLAVIWGVEGTFVIGAELYNGILTGIKDNSVRAMVTAAVCLGADIGADGFFGVYVSESAPPDVAGLELFAKFAVGWGPGICLVRGMTLSESKSFSILVTAGAEADFGGGAGWTKLGAV